MQHIFVHLRQWCLYSYYRKVETPNKNFKVITYSRCDQAIDCEDLSDEKQCKMVVIDKENYIKGKPPKEAMVKVKLELLNVLEIGEIGMVFRSQFKLYMEWFDARLTFLNLHEGKVANRIVENEKNMIWIPIMIFENTDTKQRTIDDKETVVYVNRNGSFTKSTIDHLDNEHIYHGKENTIEISRIYNVPW